MLSSLYFKIWSLKISWLYFILVIFSPKYVVNNKQRHTEVIFKYSSYSSSMWQTRDRCLTNTLQFSLTGQQCLYNQHFSETLTFAVPMWMQCESHTWFTWVVFLHMVLPELAWKGGLEADPNFFLFSLLKNWVSCILLLAITAPLSPAALQRNSHGLRVLSRHECTCCASWGVVGPECWAQARQQPIDRTCSFCRDQSC